MAEPLLATLAHLITTSPAHNAEALMQEMQAVAVLAFSQQGPGTLWAQGFRQPTKAAISESLRGIATHVKGHGVVPGWLLKPAMAYLASLPLMPQLSAAVAAVRSMAADAAANAAAASASGVHVAAGMVASGGGVPSLARLGMGAKPAAAAAAAAVLAAAAPAAAPPPASDAS
jgi:hypothetical protein